MTIPQINSQFNTPPMKRKLSEEKTSSTGEKDSNQKSIAGIVQQNVLQDIGEERIVMKKNVVPCHTLWSNKKSFLMFILYFFIGVIIIGIPAYLYKRQEEVVGNITITKSGRLELENPRSTELILTDGVTDKMRRIFESNMPFSLTINDELVTKENYKRLFSNHFKVDQNNLDKFLEQSGRKFIDDPGLFLQHFLDVNLLEVFAKFTESAVEGIEGLTGKEKTLSKFGTIANPSAYQVKIQTDENKIVGQFTGSFVDQTNTPPQLEGGRLAFKHVTAEIEFSIQRDSAGHCILTLQTSKNGISSPEVKELKPSYNG